MIPLAIPARDDAGLRAGRNAVQALNFFVAAMQTGFGPFVSVWLVSQGWSLAEVGVALSIGTVAGLIGQLPGGGIVDRVHHKRDITAIAIAVVAISALMIGAAPTIHSVWIAEILHALGSAVITPAIAAMTLTLCGPDGFGERLGGNARYAALGTALAAGAFGLASSHLGQQSIFLITAGLGLPAVASLFAIRQGPSPPTAADHMAIAPPKEREEAPWVIFRDPTMHVFALCVILFQIGNAALLPLALGALAGRGQANGFIVPAAIVVPQIVAALASPWAGRMARTVGRRPVLLVGFSALPLRALLFALVPDARAIDVFQVLDGISATVLGLMPPLIAADLTRNTGHLNLAIGSFGLAAGLGATISTTLAGWVADRFGTSMAFLGLASLGAIATLLLAAAMPETRPGEVSRESAAAA